MKILNGGKQLSGRLGDNVYVAYPGGTYVRRYVVPRNPKSEEQQKRRGCFAEAIAAWKALADEGRRAYNEAAGGTLLNGYNLFVSEFLKARQGPALDATK